MSSTLRLPTAVRPQLDIWRRQWAELPAPVELPLDRPRTPGAPARHAREAVELTEGLLETLTLAGRRQGGDLYAALLAGFLALLHRYTGRTDLVVGASLEGSAEGLLPLLVDTGGDPTFLELLGRSAAALQAARDLRELALDGAPAGGEPGRSTLRMALYLEPAAQGDEAGLDLALALVRRAGQACLVARYAADLFEAATVRRLLRHLVNLMSAAAAGVSARLSELPLLDEEEREEVLRRWNDTATGYPREASIHGLFEEQARRTPEAVAVIDDDEEVTYRELARRAEQLASWLLAAGIRPDEGVGLCGERSPDLIAALLGILKSGGAFVPLDASYPRERLGQMLADAGVRVLVVQEGLEGALPLPDGGVRVSLRRAVRERPPSAAAAPPVHPDQLAYVMFTSGSTGRPKGVAVTHRNVVRLVRDTNYARFGPDEIFLQFAPVSFDASTLEIWGPLLNGGRLVLFPPGPPDLRRLGATVERHGVTTLWLTAGLFHQMIESHLERLRPVRQLLAGGDVLSPVHVRQALAALPETRLINGYGPTEGTTFTCCHAMNGEVDLGNGSSVPIGRPIANTRVYLLDAAMRPVPVGVAGQLYAAGDGLARGYIGRPDLTAERFVPDPVSGAPGNRLYATGDLARWRTSGEIEFLGRADAQVKIRGFRIEPGEIEAVLCQHPDVQSAVVVVREDVPGDRRLVGYAVPAAGRAAAAPALRAWLKERLPAYLMPSALVVLPELPLNPNGKVDRRALPPPAREEEGFVPPSTPTESWLAGVWCSLLGLERAGTGDDFFRLGGHSLIATQVATRVRDRLGLDLELRAVFEHSTLGALAAHLDRLRGARERGAAAPLPAAAGAGPHPLSSAQQRLWFLERLRPGTALYNLAQIFDLRGELDAPALAAAFDAVVRRHEALRTLFAAGGPQEGGEPVQLVCREPLQPQPLPVVDLGGLPEPARRAEVERITREEARRPYDLEREPLLRSALLQLGFGEHRLLVGTHHIVFDAWSLGVLLRELSAFYRAARASQAPPLPPLPVQYPGFAVWQHRRLTEEGVDHLAWWREHLAGAPAVFELPPDRPRPALPSLRGERLRLPLGSDLERDLAALGRRQGATLFMTLLAAFQALLHRYTLQEDFVVGSPVAGRERLELEALIGFFVNMLPLRASAPGAVPFSRLLAGVRDTVLAAFAHQALPFDRLVEELAPQRDLARTPIFQVAFSLQEALAGPDLDVEVAAAAEVDTGVSKFDLTLIVERGPRELDAIAEYSLDLFERATVLRMLGALRALLKGALTDPDAPLGELPLLADAERDQVVRGWNQTAIELPELPVHRLFERRAAARPDAPAVVDAEESVTYGELERRSNLLAWQLRRLGVEPEGVVALLMERSPALLTGALAALKAGGAYLPIDPAYPAERVLHVLRDSRAEVLLTTSRSLAGLPEVPLPAGRRILLDETLPGGNPEEALSPPPAELHPDGLAYVIYTSGSSGAPKGTELCHRGLANLVAWQIRARGMEAADRCSMTAGPGFDASVWETWPVLASGASLHVVPRDALLSPPAILSWMAERGLTLAFLPTPLAEAVLAEPPRADLALRALQTGGDRLQRRPATGLGFELVNLYGPTECTVAATSAVVACEGHRAPHIGGPIDNLRVHLLDRGLTPLPAGVPGELCVAGVGLARGYRWRPDLTAERFVPDPLGGPGERLYRTGDLARRLPGGEIEFLGRLDQQVKIRGYRIELGEVEAALRRHPGVRDVAALVRDDRLAAYIVGQGEGFQTAELRSFLATTLPEAMIPSFWAILEALPLTPNGKVDRQALARIVPAPDAQSAAVPPRTATEEAVAEVWSGLLGLAGIGAHDDFFALGGHSLLAARLAARIYDRLGVELPLRVVFQKPTVARLAAWIDGLRHAGGPAGASSTVPESTAAPLSFAQQRLWFLDRLEPGSPAYNLPALLRFSGPLRPRVLALAFAEVVRRHDALRTTFEVPEGAADPVQVVHLPAGWPLPVVDLAALPEAAREAEAVRLSSDESRQPFDLQRGPLARTLLLRLGRVEGGDEHRLLVTLHHIVADGWSFGVLQHELAALYRAFDAAQPSPLPPLPIQYPGFAVWQRGWLSGDELERQLAYWRERLASPPAFDLPADRPRPALWSYRGAVAEGELPGELAAALERTGQLRQATPFMTLLAGFVALLHRYTGQEDLVVGSPVSGRGRADLEALIGFFVNTLPLRVDLGGEPGFLDLLARVRESALAAFAHQDLPFEKLVAEVVPERDLSRNPLFQVIFALQEGWEPVAVAPGLTLKSSAAAHSGTAKFDLSFHVDRRAAGLHLWLEYATDLFDRATIERLLGHFRLLLEEAVDRPEAPVAALPLLTAAERAQIETWAEEAHRGHPAGLLHVLFEEQAHRTPQAVALVAAGEVLTYAELARRSARLAARLRALGAAPEVAVAVCLERRADLVVALLAVLRAGAFYVPLDPRHPAERLAYLLEDSGAHILLTQSRLADSLPVTGAVQLLVDEPVTSAAPAAPDPGVLPQNLAYLIYTSGSTGRPKAVAISHASAVKLAWWAREAFAAEELRGVLAGTAVTFDLSVYEIFVPLAWGGAVVLIEDALSLLSGPPELPEGLELTLVNTVPSAIAELLREDALPATVRTINLAGEALPRALADRVYSRPATERLYNLYGPSEDTTYSTWTRVERSGERPPSIGRPVHDTRAEVVDRRLERLPLGVPGELCLAGDGLARGYLGRPDLTAERFVPDPFGEPGGRLYRTGDLARRRADGELEYLGRLDHQVKVRGYRVELGEVESALAALPGVDGAAVLPREDGAGDRRLVGYVAAAEALSSDELRQALLRILPEPMVPPAFVFLPALPLTAHGKVDRRALARVAPAAGARAASVPPSTPLEAAVAQIWSEILAVEGIGARDDFFALGGHSLLAARLVARVRERLGIELPLRVVFQESTLARLAAWIAARRHDAPAGPQLVAGLAGQAAPLSFAQQRLWFFEQLQPGSPAYNIPFAFGFKGRLRPELLAGALAEVVRRHAALRTTIQVPDGASEPVQVVHPAPAWDLPLVDLTALPDDLRAAEAARLAAEESRRPFDLRRFPLLRTTLLRLGGITGEAEHRLLATLHHIAADGWSLEIFQRETGALYDAFAAGRPSPLPELPVQYGDYAVWQRVWLTGAELERQLACWRERLADPPALELPTDRSRPSVSSRRGAVETMLLPDGLAERLEEIGRGAGATPFMALFTAFLALLQRYTSQDDLVVGTPLAGRVRPELQGLIGFFVNTLPLRVALGGDPPFVALLGRVRETVLEAYDHQDVPFERLAAELVPVGDLSRNPLFQVVFALQDRLEPVRIDGDVVFGTGDWVHHGTAKFDLTLHVQRAAGELELWAEYSTDLFDRATVGRLQGHYRRLLEGIASNPDRKLSELPLLDEAEREQVLTAWNRTAAEIPDEPVHGLALRWAEATPDAVAVSWEGGSLTYGGLARRASELARRLRRRGVGPETVVALRLERSAELVIAAFAVLETGGAYLPIDPAHPQERAEWIVRDSRAALLLTREHLEGSAPAPLLSAEERERVFPDSLAYVIYTSGSTGAPKGTELRHRALSNIVAWHRRTNALEPADRTTLLAGPGFDASVWEMWAALTAGASLHLPYREVLLSPPELLAWMKDRGITVSFLPTPLAEALLAEMESRPVQLSLRHLLTGGDRLRRRPAPSLPFTVLNHYGPTESTVVATAGSVAPKGERVPDIGVPVANTRVYLLDRWLQPVPTGVAGEICLAGEGLARGYRGKPELTAAAFVPDPFGDGGRLYRTGDLARWLPSGEIEFVGRIDQQVKIRGFRIELGEIEATLGLHPAVREAAVLVREERLVAYVAARGGVEPVTAEILRGWLGRSLPEVMIPTSWVFLEAIPLTPNGKIDSRALPAPAQDEKSFVPPATETQRALAAIWGSLLGLERIGARDHFFQLGGHSLSATQVASRVEERFGVALELGAIFEHPVLEELAAHIDHRRRPRQTARGGRYPLSPAQQRLWFLNRLFPGSAACSLSALLAFVGPLRPALLATALAGVVRRHAALRTTFELADARSEEPVQVVHPPSEQPLPMIDLAGLSAAAREAEAERIADEEAGRPFDLGRGPLLRTTLLRLGAEEHRLLAAAHRAVADDRSLDLLLREVGALYGAFAAGLSSPLPEPPLQYPDFAVRQRDRLAGGGLERQLAGWRERLAQPPCFELPLDRPRPAVWSHLGEVVVRELPETLAALLERFARERDASPYLVLLAGFVTLLHRWTGAEDLLVGTTADGREAGELFGPLANLLPLRIDLAGEPSFLAVLDRVRESDLAARAGQDVPFGSLAAELVPEPDLSRNPLFPALFTFTERIAPVAIAPGLTAARAESARSRAAQCDLSFHVVRTAGRMRLRAEYASALFERATVLGLGERFIGLLEEALSRPEEPVATLRTGGPRRTLAPQDGAQRGRGAREARPAAFVPPQTPLEEEVAQVWAGVLGVDRVGSNDSFWSLGGGSLLAVRALARIEDSFGVDLPLQSLFTSPTLAGFSSALAERVLASAGEAEIEGELAALGAMSDEEIRALIEQSARELGETA